MSEPIDRRTVLSSALAWAAVTLSGCSDNASGGPACPSGSGGTGGTGVDAGGALYTCATSMTGTHQHPLKIPSSDVERGFQDAPYTLEAPLVLEAGGTCHTHTLELTAYDYAYLQAGATRMIDSSATANHMHTVTITCTPT